MQRGRLLEQDLATLDVTRLTPLSPEVISRQATINIGTPRAPWGGGRRISIGFSPFFAVAGGGPHASAGLALGCLRLG